jgi:hypothetical protein
LPSPTALRGKARARVSDCRPVTRRRRSPARQKEIGKRLTKLVQTIGKERIRCQSSRDAQNQGLNSWLCRRGPEAEDRKGA